MHVSHLIGVVVGVGVLVITSGPDSARAQSQTGGLPAVSDRVRVLEGIAVTLQRAVTTLQTNVTSLKTTVTTLQTKVTTLETENTGLQSALDAEAAARADADERLAEFLVSETLARKAADAAINNSVAALSADLGAIAQLGKVYEKDVALAELVNGAEATVAVLDGVPAGHYFVIAKAEVRNFDNNATWICHLIQNNDLVFPLDFNATITQSQEGDSGMALTAVTTLAAPGSFGLDCFSLEPASSLQQIKIIAISVR